MPTADLARLEPEPRIVCLGARTVLDEDARAFLSTVLRDDPDWGRIWDLGHRHEVLPLLAERLPAAAKVGGAIVPTDWLVDARRRRHAVLAQNGAVAETLGMLLDGLRAADVPVIPVKGIVTALRWYGDLATRPAADIDILVRPEDLGRAQAALRSMGLHQPPTSRFADLVHDFHDAPWVAQGRFGRTIVELHWSVWSDRAHPGGPASLWAHARTERLLDRDVLVLDPVDALVHLAIHRTRSALRLRWVADVAELVRHEGAVLDWDGVIGRASERQARTATWVVLDLAAGLLGAPVPARVLDALRPSSAKAHLLERTCGATALFRPARADDLRQQPHLTLRLLEQDGAARIGRNLAWSLRRSTRRVAHEHGLREVGPRPT